MNIEEIVSKYIVSTEHALKEIGIVESTCVMSKDLIRQLVELAKAYLYDAKYYKEKRRFEVSLASVAYCEGLLDALRMLGLVKFEWPKKEETEESK